MIFYVFFDSSHQINFKIVFKLSEQVVILFSSDPPSQSSAFRKIQIPEISQTNKKSNYVFDFCFVLIHRCLHPKKTFDSIHRSKRIVDHHRCLGHVSFEYCRRNKRKHKKTFPYFAISNLASQKNHSNTKLVSISMIQSGS